jgi:hypothetical protein
LNTGGWQVFKPEYSHILSIQAIQEYSSVSLVTVRHRPGSAPHTKCAAVTVRGARLTHIVHCSKGVNNGGQKLDLLVTIPTTPSISGPNVSVSYSTPTVSYVSQALLTTLGYACLGASAGRSTCASGSTDVDPTTAECSDGSQTIMHGPPNARTRTRARQTQPATRAATELPSTALSSADAHGTARMRQQSTRHADVRCMQAPNSCSRLSFRTRRRRRRGSTRRTTLPSSTSTAPWSPAPRPPSMRSASHGPMGT